MKICLNCIVEYRDECDNCYDCGRPLTVLNESQKRMLEKLKNPALLITLDDGKEREFLKELLEYNNITFYAVEAGATGTESGSELFYVEKSRLDIAKPVIEEFQYDMNIIKENAEKKAGMIKPVLLITVSAGTDMDVSSLLYFLDEHHIAGYFEMEKWFQAGSRVAFTGIMDGRDFTKKFVYVEEMYYEEAQMLLSEFLKQKPEEENQILEKTEYDDYESLWDMLKKVFFR